MSNTYELTVKTKDLIAHSVYEFTFESLAGNGAGELPSWTPGAHIDLHMPGGIVRQYSLCGDDEKTWRIAVFIEPESRGGSRFLATQLNVGDAVTASGPRNHFELTVSPQLNFIAGGIGITPLIPMLEAANVGGIDWQLYYLGKSRAQLAYLDVLEKAYGDRVRLHLSDDGNRFNVEEWSNSERARYSTYVCGPVRLLDELVMHTSDESLIRTEYFSPKQTEFEQNKSFTVFAAKSDVEFVVPADESILMAADFEGIEIEGDCLEGTCGSCETRIISGEAEHRDSILSTSQKNAGQSMMICVSRARGQSITLDL